MGANGRLCSLLSLGVALVSRDQAESGEQEEMVEDIIADLSMSAVLHTAEHGVPQLCEQVLRQGPHLIGALSHPWA